MCRQRSGLRKRHAVVGWSMVLILCAVTLLFPFSVRAASSDGVVYEDPDNHYKVVVEDDADLLTGEQEEQLAAQMQAITRYGNVGFKTIASNKTSTAEFAKSYFHGQFNNESGIVFLIDMANRKIWIFCDGKIYRTVTKSYANTITDNVYTFASNGDYYQCASSAFDQAYNLLEGNRIAQPMKYICNGLLAIISALLFNFGLVKLVSRTVGMEDKKLLKYAENRFSMSPPDITFLEQTKHYNPSSSSSSSGSSSSSSSSSSGGGGGSSGGGGGHSF